VRYSTILEELEVNLERSSLTQFLRTIKNPAFRDRIYTIYLYTPEPPECDSDDESSMNVRSEQSTAFERAAEEFRASSEAAHQLAECFQNLEKAKNLQRIELLSDFGHDMVLRAMSLAQFSRQLAYIGIEPNTLSRVGYGMLSTSPQACAPYIKGLRIQPDLSSKEHTAHKLSVEQQEENPLGLHIKNYRPTTPEFTQVVSALVNVGSLEFSGCRPDPALHLCHGCEDLFAKNFARTIFPNLSCFAVQSAFISGSRLRGFIKRHAMTLTNVDVSFVSLTDGSWRSIAQGLAKLPHLQILKLHALRQKGRNPRIARPPQYSNSSAVALEDTSHVRHFLDVFIAFFSTVECLNTFRFASDPPKYHEARLFELPELRGASDRNGLLKAVAALQAYAEAVDVY
jgi:hypothetical protein